LLFEAWNNIPGTTVNLLLQDERFRNGRPDVRRLATAFNTRTVYANDENDDYGGRLSGWLVPKETGSYEFFLRSADSSQLRLSPDANPGNAVVIAEETECCDPFHEPGDIETSAPINLAAGNPYAIQVVWKAGAGPDYVQVAWRKAGDTNLAANLQPIPGEFLQTQWDPTVGLPVFTKPPQGVSAGRGTEVTFSVETAIGDQPITYQWSFGGTNIAGATNATLTVDEADLDTLGIYTISAENAFGSSTASAALFIRGTLFIEAEDFDFGRGGSVTNKAIGMTGPYRGDAFRGLGNEADEGIDYHADGDGALPYRADTNIDAGKENQQAEGLFRGDFSVLVNNVVSSNDPGEWQNYSRQFPTRQSHPQPIGRSHRRSGNHQSDPAQAG
jgi:hypothetical protein